MNTSSIPLLPRTAPNPDGESDSEHEYDSDPEFTPRPQLTPRWKNPLSQKRKRLLCALAIVSGILILLSLVFFAVKTRVPITSSPSSSGKQIGIDGAYEEANTYPGSGILDLSAIGDPARNGYAYLPERVASAFALSLFTSLSNSPNSSQFSAHNSLDYHAHNTLTLLTLSSCLALKNCGPNQQKIALLAAHWFDEAVVRGWRGGEGVWAVSVYKNLRALGYTTLFANNFEEALAQYRLFPDLVKVIIRNTPAECHLSPTCVKSPSNPTGIPAWKIFDFEFFPSPRGEHHGASKLGGKWILSANPDPGKVLGEETFQYIGYSIEDDCLTSSPPIRLSKRPHQAWMLMKQLEYLYDRRFAWNTTYFSLASSVLSSTSTSTTNTAETYTFQFLAAYQKDPYYLGWDPVTQGAFTDIHDPSHGVINLGKIGPIAFTQRLKESRVMLGVGNPFMSPSPWMGLCLGVPFVNPIITWNHDDPWNRSFWDTQHPSMNHYEPPYVYHVHARNFSGFIQAIQAASSTEIPSFTPTHMTHPSIQHRLTYLMETDWRAKAEILLEERTKQKASGRPDVYTFEL